MAEIGSSNSILRFSIILLELNLISLTTLTLAYFFVILKPRCLFLTGRFTGSIGFSSSSGGSNNDGALELGKGVLSEFSSEFGF